MSASASTSVNCNSANAVGYEPGSPEDLYRAPPGCPSGVDKIPSVYSSISAASAVGSAAPPEESTGHLGGGEGGPETYWECTDPSNPPESAKGPDGRVTMRPVGCPSRSTMAPGEDKTKSAVPNEGTNAEPQHRTGTSTFAEATASTAQVAAPSAEAQKEGEDEKDNNAAASRKVGVAGLLAAVALAVVNF